MILKVKLLQFALRIFLRTNDYEEEANAHGRRKDFFQGVGNSGFSRGSQKDFCRGGQKW